MRLLFLFLSRALIILAAYWLLRRLGKMFFGRRPDTAAIAGELKKDPSCGAYVATEVALKIRVGTEDLHFCSSPCREKYLLDHRKSSA